MYSGRLCGQCAFVCAVGVCVGSVRLYGQFAFVWAVCFRMYSVRLYVQCAFVYCRVWAFTRSHEVNDSSDFTKDGQLI